ncbi:hypothetical protein BS50DRAFT_572754 [Corynespora cassiicola Philippines]|uniref:Ketopantoate reductase N-terminal domain-containing protein n=1 Tax=Corynespora cassiicola Philippines TaxID=1448308 RepID=A0A2T2NQM5_CORCC|nr:hypothetical protein BS50DRAFT_572754 [Corynespora cassiicola Philippines]
MAKPKILIVGCGSVGMVQGYHLSSGADITYLVRPGRSPAFAPPKRLYDYKANALRTFDNYRVVESTDDLLGEEFYLVFDTLDGHTARSEGGAATLSAVGKLIRDKPETFVVYDAIGLDIDDHYATTMGIAKERLMLGFSMLAHQPTKSISIPASADRGLVAQADMLYSHQPGNVGLLLFNTQKKLAKAMQEVYNKNGTLHIQFLPGFMAGWAPLLAMLHLMSWKIDGYQDFDHLQNNRELWSLMLRAQKEILNLPRFGWTGWLLSLVLGSWATAKVNKGPMDGALPLSYREFNAFHHGEKVVKQDIQVLKDIVVEGERHGRKMEALRSICHKVD